MLAVSLGQSLIYLSKWTTGADRTKGIWNNPFRLQNAEGNMTCQFAENSHLLPHANSMGILGE